MVQTHMLADGSAEHMVALARAVDSLARLGGDDVERSSDDDFASDSGLDDATAASTQDDIAAAQAALPGGLENDDGDCALASPSSRSSPGESRDQSSWHQVKTVKKRTRKICSAFRWHCPPPACLGSGAESLQHKCSAMLHSLTLESSSMRALARNLERCVALCTDMGTEMGLADVVGSSLYRLVSTCFCTIWVGRARDCRQERR